MQAELPGSLRSVVKPSRAPSAHAQIHMSFWGLVTNRLPLPLELAQPVKLYCVATSPAGMPWVEHTHTPPLEGIVMGGAGIIGPDEGGDMDTLTLLGTARPPPLGLGTKGR